MIDHRRPAGVDPSVLCEVTKPAPCDARAIGRRVAMKALAKAIVDSAEPPAGVTGAERELIVCGLDLAALVEAEIRSTGGTPPLGSVDLRLGYVEALLVVTSIVEAIDDGRPATEREILSELRAKFFRGLGLTEPC